MRPFARLPLHRRAAPTRAYAGDPPGRWSTVGDAGVAHYTMLARTGPRTLSTRSRRQIISASRATRSVPRTGQVRLWTFASTSAPDMGFCSVPLACSTCSRDEVQHAALGLVDYLGRQVFEAGGRDKRAQPRIAIWLRRHAHRLPANEPSAQQQAQQRLLDVDPILGLLEGQ
jgi:hypothetical protein